MKYKITIEKITPPVGDSKYPDTETVYEQIVDKIDGLVAKIAILVNTISE